MLTKAESAVVLDVSVVTLIALVPISYWELIKIETTLTLAVIINFVIIATIQIYRKELADLTNRPAYLYGTYYVLIPWIIGGIVWLLLLVSKPFSGLPLSYRIGPETIYLAVGTISFSVLIALFYWRRSKITLPKHG